MDRSHTLSQAARDIPRSPFERLRANGLKFLRVLFADGRRMGFCVASARVAPRGTLAERSDLGGGSEHVRVADSKAGRLQKCLSAFHFSENCFGRVAPSGTLAERSDLGGGSEHVRVARRQDPVLISEPSACRPSESP
jgi:hypothetical protein